MLAHGRVHLSEPDDPREEGAVTSDEREGRAGARASATRMEEPFMGGWAGGFWWVFAGVVSVS